MMVYSGMWGSLYNHYIPCSYTICVAQQYGRYVDDIYTGEGEMIDDIFSMKESEEEEVAPDEGLNDQ